MYAQLTNPLKIRVTINKTTQKTKTFSSLGCSNLLTMSTCCVGVLQCDNGTLQLQSLGTSYRDTLSNQSDLLNYLLEDRQSLKCRLFLVTLVQLTVDSQLSFFVLVQFYSFYSFAVISKLPQFLKISLSSFVIHQTFRVYDLKNVGYSESILVNSANTLDVGPLYRVRF